jgi:hypothetical protein
VFSRFVEEPFTHDGGGAPGAAEVR